MREGAAALIASLCLCAAAPARLHAQDAGRPEPLPTGQLFSSLLADPKQPHFFAAWLWVSSPALTGQVSSIGLGEDVGLLRGRAKNWQVSVAAGVFSQFDMESSSNDLLNTDFLIGLPFTYRRAGASLRARIYHQSSHLGDEFLLGANPARVNLSFEAVELLWSQEAGGVRAYGGGEYIVRREPAELRRGMLHGGIEYRAAAALLRLGGLGDGRVIAALDLKATEERRWRISWSGRLGVEFHPVEPAATRRLSVQLQAYSGPVPYGQSYGDDIRSVGLGLHFSL